jgi:hypothetical protein
MTVFGLIDSLSIDRKDTRKIIFLLEKWTLMEAKTNKYQYSIPQPPNQKYQFPKTR